MQSASVYYKEMPSLIRKILEMVEESIEPCTESIEDPPLIFDTEYIEVGKIIDKLKFRCYLIYIL